MTAAYLGKAGLRTVVLERRDTLGGAAGTSELAPGARVPTLAHTVGRLRPSVVRDLDLKRHGLSLVGPDVRAFAPGLDGDAVVLWGDVARTAEGLRARSAADADRVCRLRPARPCAVRASSASSPARTPPDIESPGLGDALAGLRLGRTFRGLGRDDGRTITRVLPMAIADFVAESFETDALRAAIAWRGVQYTAMGPWSAGTTAVLLTDSAGNDGGAAGQTVYARGGPGALAAALEGAAREAGVEIRTGAEVVAITSRDGRATGVALACGEEITRTGRRRRHRPEAGPDRAWPTRSPSARTCSGGPATSGRRARSPRSTSSSPGCRGSPPRATRRGCVRGRILVAPGIDAMERAHDAAKFGRLPDAPILEATIPSLADPSLVDGAAPGTHVMSVIVGAVPYAPPRPGLGRRSRGARRPRRRGRSTRYAPGLAGLVTARQVLTPLDLERDYGLTGGHPMHGEHGLDQFFLWRPLLGHARYRLALDGLYLAGAGSHPGGGITGRNGQNAAREIVGDLRRRRR